MKNTPGLIVSSFPSWKAFKSDLYDKMKELQEAEATDVDALSMDPRRFLFRGHASSNWTLEAAFDRAVREKRKSGDWDVEGKYSEIIEQFVEDCQYFGIVDEIPGSYEARKILYLEELAQHFGLPTRLLDWSGSPFVAAFFAFSEERKCETGFASIWVLDKFEMSRCWRKEDVDIIATPVSNNPRMRMQQGLFTRNRSTEGALEEVFREGKGSKNVRTKVPVIYKLDIPISEASIAMEDLQRMGLNFIRLFPGIEGICKEHEYKIWKKVATN